MKKKEKKIIEQCCKNCKWRGQDDLIGTIGRQSGECWHCPIPQPKFDYEFCGEFKKKK